MQRLLVSFSIAVLGIVATTNSAFAAFDPTSDELSIGTFVVAVCAMAVLLMIYGIKWYFGLDVQPENPDLHDTSNASLPAGGAPHH
jgi:hypothetical protein